MVFESHFCPSESGTRFPECDWLLNGFDGSEIGARCADVSATDANWSCKFTPSVNETSNSIQCFQCRITMLNSIFILSKINGISSEVEFHRPNSPLLQ